MNLIKKVLIVVATLIIGISIVAAALAAKGVIGAVNFTE